MSEEEEAILGNHRGGDDNSNPWAQPRQRPSMSGFGNSVIGLLCIALPLGAVAGYANILFLIFIDEVMYLGYGKSGHDGMAADGEAPLTHMIISLAVGGLAVGLLTYYLMPKGTNVGFAGVLEAVRLRNAEISWREGVGVALISAISIGCGASVGRYGPCLLYTSDAADEEDSVDLGGRRFLKKKK
eukprot:TRINITY_DN13534_c0_g1_i3.p1 TRINITY_DN13534_c0_g1~~TRINITY_DN13534_c0_g1_i3.p1  ORF type:complete len:186 (+),score=34.60 TRINITY_DN13534_c0_g1_i3:51-608(+)